MYTSILSNANTATHIDWNSPTPYGDSCGNMNAAGVNQLKFTQQGLAVKTYQSDLFNNWLRTEWFEGPDGINELTKVDTSDGGFTIDALRLMNKVNNVLNRIAASGGTYQEWLRS